MLDQVAGRPSPSWRRTQVFTVLLFWLLRVSFGSRTPPRLFWLRRLNRLLHRFSPWQLILSTLTLVYAFRHADVLLGLQAPEPLARLYSRDYYRATWIVTALDAGFATAMGIKWKWLRDIASLTFSGYYLLFAHEADEKIRKYRAFCTVEMLRLTWEKQGNPYIQLATRQHRPPVLIMKKLFLERPKGSKYTKPITAHLYFHGTELELAAQNELVMDFPGGGFICMSPEHHAERLLRWARQTKKVVLSFDYGKAPEYPFPFAIDEMYDAYSLLHATKGKCIGMNIGGNKDLRVIVTGDSAGANIATAMIVKILETRSPPPASPSRSKTPCSLPSSASAPSNGSLPLPVALIFAYPALSFHFTSWMPSSDLRVLRSESHPDVASILRGKEHLDHRAPLSVVEDVERRSAGSERGRPKVLRRKRTTSWGRGLVRGLPSSMSFRALRGAEEGVANGLSADGEEEEEVPITDEREKSISERVVWWDGIRDEEKQKELKERVVKEAERVRGELESGKAEGSVGETRLAMTSRTAFFNDRIISPPMCRAMALLYIGPRNAPDLHSDYHISPIFTPANLLAQFPPLYMSCGERDPFVDDTVIFAGKLREAKEARKMELLARETRHGESLRMSDSLSSDSRRALLDENEDDWVRTSIIAGWSHGYLQMVSLLPAAEKVIAMMGDWIDEAFEKAEAKPQRNGTGGTRLSPTVSVAASPRLVPSPEGVRTACPARPIKVPPPTLVETPASVPSPGLSSSKPLTPQTSANGASESEKEEDILTFTPKRRRDSSTASRAGTPSPVVVAGTSSPTLQRSALWVPVALHAGEHDLSSPSSSATQPLSLDESSSVTSAAAHLPQHPPPQHLVTPAERALRDELATLPSLSSSSNSGGNKLSFPLSHSPLASVASPSAAKPHFLTEPLNTPQPRPGSAKPACYLDAAAHPHPHPPRAGGGGSKLRSGSTGSLPHPQGAIFVDAKDLLRRRRDDVVFGLSTSTAASQVVSRAASPEGLEKREVRDGRDDEDEEKGETRMRRRGTTPL
ncbi:hypothetical protein JCM11641_005706 [Rhodosporidiobolus odoratus]